MGVVFVLLNGIIFSVTFGSFSQHEKLLLLPVTEFLISNYLTLFLRAILDHVPNYSSSPANNVYQHKLFAE